MRTVHIAILGLIAASVMVALAPMYVAAGDQPQNVSGPQSPATAKDVTHSPSNAGKGLFVPACILDSTMWSQRSKDGPRMDRRPKTRRSPAPAADFRVGTFECQS
jgi:hypothetical protein